MIKHHKIDSAINTSTTSWSLTISNVPRYYVYTLNVLNPPWHYTVQSCVQ